MSRTRIPLSKYEEQSRNLNRRLEMSTAEIGLSVRTTNCLEERGIFTVKDLLHCQREDLLGISNFGEIYDSDIYILFNRISRRNALGVLIKIDDHNCNF